MGEKLTSSQQGASLCCILFLNPTPLNGKDGGGSAVTGAERAELARLNLRRHSLRLLYGHGIPALQ
jgi:hypothetical protein